jgi:ABC-type branched-subunit amino acid transport system substrate-binding protein
VSRRICTLVVLTLLVAVACGQKEGVHVATGGGSPDGESAGTATTAGASVGTVPKGPGDTNGVTDTEVRIGVHAPLTGAGANAPSFEQGKDLYFQSVGPINGRTVKVFFEDDKYNPSSAVEACKKMVEQDRVFLLVGGGGADQINACATYADRAGVPYLAEGVGEAGLDELRSYFALSMTYKQQGVLLAQYIKNVVNSTKVAMVRADTANFADAHTGFVAGVKAQKLDLVQDITVPKDAAQAELQSAAVALCGGSKPEVVYPLMAPVLFLQFAAAVHSQDCTVRWAGVGVTIGLNIVAAALCGGNAIPGGASFFSPFTGIDDADTIDPAFQQTWARVNGGRGDDIAWGLWGAQKLLGAMLQATGRDLTRQNFVNAVNGKTFSTKVYADVDFSKSRFGGKGVHVLKADCDKRPPAYVTESSFKSSF